MNRKYIGLGSLIVILVIVVISLTVYRFWQSSKETILFTADNGAIRFVTQKTCVGWLEVKQQTPRDNDLETFDALLPRAKQWPKNSPYISFSIMTQATYRALSTSNAPNKPVSLFSLSNGNVVAQYGPQDQPPTDDLPPGCTVTAKSS